MVCIRSGGSGTRVSPTVRLSSLAPPWLCFSLGSSVVARNSQCPSDHTVTLGSSCFSGLSLAMSPRMVVLGSSWNNLARTSTQFSSNQGLDQCLQGHSWFPPGTYTELIVMVSVAYTEEINGVGNKCLIGSGYILFVCVVLCMHAHTEARRRC